jgi:hypothetical protein
MIKGKDYFMRKESEWSKDLEEMGKEKIRGEGL